MRGVQEWENNFDLIPERHQAFMHKLKRFLSAEAKMAYLEKCAEKMTVDEWSKESGQLLYISYLSIVTTYLSNFRFPASFLFIKPEVSRIPRSSGSNRKLSVFAPEIADHVGFRYCNLYSEKRVTTWSLQN